MAGLGNIGGAPTTETHRLIYRIDTGAIVAIKTVWVEEGAEVEGPEPTTRHLDSIIQGIAAQAGSLGILKVKVLPTGPMRVDLVTGTLIARQQGITEEFASVIAAPSEDDRSAHQVAPTLLAGDTGWPRDSAIEPSRIRFEPRGETSCEPSLDLLP